MSFTPSPAFESASKAVNNLTTTPENALMLLAYALYKQTTVGNVTGSRPNVFDQKGRTKYDCWTYVKDEPQEKTQEMYINCSEHLVNGAVLSEDNLALLEKIKNGLKW